MKQSLAIYFLLFLCSCGKDRAVLLPEIQHASITKITDVSPAYIFYDETLPDSTLLNRKNLIGTTNWLVNVDKRLTLDQALPKVKYLQDKKRNKQMHINENAKNYFTCNDTSVKNLGFIEFTDVNYILSNDALQTESLSIENKTSIHIIARDEIIIQNASQQAGETNKTLNSIQQLKTEVNALSQSNQKIQLSLVFNSKLTFQDYISFKFALESLETESLVIDSNEFIN